jgi:hypothetical protein
MSIWAIIGVLCMIYFSFTTVRLSEIVTNPKPKREFFVTFLVALILTVFFVFIAYLAGAR